MVTEHCCPRVSKEAIVLGADGIHVDVLCKRRNVSLPFKNVYYWRTRDDLMRQLSRLTGYDVWHVHNEPNWPLQACLDTPGRPPVVWDIHDLDFVRYHAPRGPEAGLAMMADARIVPCRGYADALGTGTVVYSMVPRGLFTWHDDPVDLVVLDGHVNVDKRAHAPWLDYRDVLTRFEAATGKPVVVQSGERRHGLTHQNSKAILCEKADFSGLFHRLRMFRWGLVGGGVPCPQWDVAMPNKLFEYLACGVVPVCLWASEAAEYVTERGVGVVIDSPEDAAKKLTKQRWKKCREAIRKQWDDFALESRVPTIKSVYENVTA